MRKAWATAGIIHKGHIAIPCIYCGSAWVEPEHSGLSDKFIAMCQVDFIRLRGPVSLESHGTA